MRDHAVKAAFASVRRAYRCLPSGLLRLALPSRCALCAFVQHRVCGACDTISTEKQGTCVAPVRRHIRVAAATLKFRRCLATPAGVRCDRGTGRSYAGIRRLGASAQIFRPAGTRALVRPAMASVRHQAGVAPDLIVPVPFIGAAIGARGIPIVGAATPPLPDRPQLRSLKRNDLQQPPRRTGSLRGSDSFEGFGFLHIHTVRPATADTIYGDRTVESTNWNFGRRCKPPPRGKTFTILNTAADATGRRRWRLWPALTHFQSIFASSIDSSFERAQCPDESCRHVPLTVNAAEMKPWFPI